MRKYDRVTALDVPIGYSSDPDDDEEEEPSEALPLLAKPNEVYVGNTGQLGTRRAPFKRFYRRFKEFGDIQDMAIWRTHGHLYHARITYRTKKLSMKAVRYANDLYLNYYHLRVVPVAEPFQLDFANAIRIDGLIGDLDEQYLHKHFRPCGNLRFVIKTGTAAYIQFEQSSGVAKAFEMKMMMKDIYVYTTSRISADDKIDHMQVLENMKAIRLRKPLVMVENYPKLPEGTPLCQYKSKFESAGTTVRYFKIKPGADGTVQLALCMDTKKERDLVIDQFNGTTIGDKQLKLYIMRREVRMTNEDVQQYVVAPNTITVDKDIPPYYSDYEVSIVFSKCGPISFLQKFETSWTICFDNSSATLLAEASTVAALSKKLAVESKVIERAKKRATGIAASKTKPKPKPALVRKSEEPSILRPAKKRPAENNKFTAELSSDPPPESETKGPIPLSELRPEFTKFLVQISNLPKGIEEIDVRRIVTDSESKFSCVFLYCTEDLYRPTSIAYVRLISGLDTGNVILRHHHGVTYREKRIRVRHAEQLPDWNFTPERSVMLKNLPKYVTEEGIVQELEALNLKVEDVTRPAYHYAYVEFTVEFRVDDKLLTGLRNALRPHNIEVFPLYQSVPKSWMHIRSFDITSIKKVRQVCGLREDDAPTGTTGDEFGVHNAHKLFVGNIPRDTLAEDVIDYFNNFGSVTDYVPIEKKSCYLRKSVILSFVNEKHAQNVFRQLPHVLEGSTLDVHLMDSPPGQFLENSETKLVTVKSHSRFLTNDEIRNALQSMFTVCYQMRFDAFDDRANFVASYRAPKKFDVESFREMKYINDEAVKIVPGYDPTPPTEDEARETVNISNSPHRQQKEQYLMYVIDKEHFKDDMEVCSRSIRKTDIRFEAFYDDNSVQINNVSPDTTLENLRNLFIKCGDIADYRALFLGEDASKICYVKFKTDLAADLACTYSQRMVDGKRILVHLAKETLVVEHGRSVMVERLNPTTTTEQLHDAFSTIGMVKYVQKQSPFSAIVCFKDTDCMAKAANVTIPNSGPFNIHPCNQVYNHRFFMKFSCKEEVLPIKRMQAVLKPRILPEFHQVELERRGQVFDDLPDAIQSLLIEEVFSARKLIPTFDQLNYSEQIYVLETKCEGFTQKDYFSRLNLYEQTKLLTMTGSNMQQDEEVLDLDEEVLDSDEDIPMPKHRRKWSHKKRKGPQKTTNDPRPDQRVALMGTNASSYVAQTLPAPGLLGSFGNIGPPLQMGPPLSNNEYPRFPTAYPVQISRPFFNEVVPPVGYGPNPPVMMRPGPVPMMPGPPMGGMTFRGPPAPPEYRSIQQWNASMPFYADFDL